MKPKHIKAVIFGLELFAAVALLEMYLLG